MITGVDVAGFKRFRLAPFDFAPLTVLTGLNGSGKTSLLQSLLLAAEAGRARASSVGLNGSFGLELGTAEDVLNWESASPISIGVRRAGDTSSTWVFDVPEENALYLNVAERPDHPPKPFTPAPRVFTYLSAERLGPRGFTAVSALPGGELEVGVNGQYCAHVLSVLGGHLIEHVERAHPSYEGKARRLLKYEVEQWLAEITREIEVDGVRVAGSAVAELRFRAPGADWVRSTNMGFGITYALPIILAGLIAETGGLLIVENPEAHLHPAGQSRMGVFLAWLAGSGVQVLIETHSDHVVNGIRRAVAEHEYLDHSDAIMHWFGDGSPSDDAVSTAPTIGESGNVSDWPEGFFDQYQIDVGSLGRIRRRRERS